MCFLATDGHLYSKEDSMLNMFKIPLYTIIFILFSFTTLEAADSIPAGTIKISNKVNGHYLAVRDLTLWDHFLGFYESLFGGQCNESENGKVGYVIAGQKNMKSVCWLPVNQIDQAIAFQYVCSGKYHNYYLDIQDKEASDGYLRLIVRQELPSASNWNINSKEDGTFTYDSSRDLFKGYYIAIRGDDIAEVSFGEMGPSSRWYQTTSQPGEVDENPTQLNFKGILEKIISKFKI